MRDLLKERASLVAKRDLAARHEFDYLSINTTIEVRAARDRELPFIADMGRRLVPGVQIAEPGLRKYLAFDPECILAFIRRDVPVGAMAFLYLNRRGHDALMLGEISLTHPDIGLLAGGNDEVSAIYIWAIAASGRGIAGLGKAAAHLRAPRYVSADCFAQPSTSAGRDILTATGFRQITSCQPDLWRYQRPWNRVPSLVSHASTIKSTRSFADARQ
jgi:hypothetical protein